ncbi:MAG: hypothetical protein ACFFAK_13980 [Promethearchaeota archaeon]
MTNNPLSIIPPSVPKNAQNKIVSINSSHPNPVPIINDPNCSKSINIAYPYIIISFK